LEARKKVLVTVNLRRENVLCTHVFVKPWPIHVPAAAVIHEWLPLPVRIGRKERVDAKKTYFHYNESRCINKIFWFKRFQ